LSLKHAELFVVLPHSDSDEVVNFASGVEFFYPGTHENRQVQNYPTFLLPNNTFGYPSFQFFFFFTAPTFWE